MDKEDVVYIYNGILLGFEIFQSGCTISHSHQQCLRVLISLPSSATLVIVWLFESSYPSGCEVVSHCDFVLRFPDDWWLEHLFMCLLAICIFFLEKYLFTSFVTCKLGLLSFITELWEFFIYSGYKPLNQIYGLQIFSLTHALWHGAYLSLLDPYPQKCWEQRV